MTQISSKILPNFSNQFSNYPQFNDNIKKFTEKVISIETPQGKKEEREWIPISKNNNLQKLQTEKKPQVMPLISTKKVDNIMSNSNPFSCSFIDVPKNPIKSPFACGSVQTSSTKSPFACGSVETSSIKSPFACGSVEKPRIKSPFACGSVETSSKKSPFACGSVEKPRIKSPFACGSVEKPRIKSPFACGSVETSSMKSPFACESVQRKMIKNRGHFENDLVTNPEAISASTFKAEHITSNPWFSIY